MAKAREQRSLLRKIIEYSLVVVVIGIIAYIYYTIADDAAEIFRANNEKDYTALKEYIKSHGFKGAAVLSFLEMAQMIVVFIPAEFVQVSAGLGYPVYIALPICMFGVFCGSSIIFLIVRCLHLRLDYIESKTGKIEEYIAKINKDVSMTVIMYILFVMPLIPFGAIAYFASSSKIKYPRYAFVCTTGVIPSILTSYVVGNVMYNYLGEGTAKFITAIVVVVLLVIILLLTTASIIKRRFFKKTYEKSNFFLYHVVFFFVRIYFAFLFKVRKKECVRPKNKPYIILGRHTSFYDFYFLGRGIYPSRPTFVCNRYFIDNKKTRFLVKRLGIIPKRLFTVDIDTMRYIHSAVKQKCPLIIFSEGRLSNDGSSLGAMENTERLIKKLGIDVYGYYTVGGFFAKPKWRKNTVRHKVDVYIKPLFTAQELSDLSETEITARLNNFYTYDESDGYLLQHKKCGHADVSGFEGVVYRCPSCGHEYALSTTKTTLKCDHCNSEFVFDDNYRTSDGKKLSDYVTDIKNAIREEIRANGLNYSEPCTIRKFNDKHEMAECGSGICTFTESGISYVGTDGGKEVSYSKTITEMPALAYGCNDQFEFYVGTQLVYFYPENPKSCAKWSLTWDVLREDLKYE